MGNGSKQTQWLRKVRQFIKDEWNVDSDVKHSKHLNVTLTRAGTAKRWLWVVSATPSDVNAVRASLGDLRRGLCQHFQVGCQQPLGHFPMQDVFLSADTDDAREERWDDLCDSLFDE